MLMDISDFDGLDDIKEAYLETDKELEYVPMDGVYAMPYMANAAGVLYNKDMFEEHGWTIPTTWMNSLFCVKNRSGRNSATVFWIQRFLDLSGSVECDRCRSGSV